jgi:DNA-binding IclR family transcriptional regulator
MCIISIVLHGASRISNTVGNAVAQGWAMSNDKVKKSTEGEPKEVPNYQAPALEKGLDIIELLAVSGVPLSRSDIARQMNRSVGEIYRMLHQLVKRSYVAMVNDSYVLSTKLFELAHYNPPTQRLLVEALPIMQKLASDIDQACHLTVYSQGRQIVIAKVDVPSGMGFSVRVGSELDVLVSASGRVLLAFQEEKTRAFRVEESMLRADDTKVEDILPAIQKIAEQGFEAAPSGQVKGLFAISFPILDLRGFALAALTVPYADRLDQTGRKSVEQVRTVLADAAKMLTSRVSGRGFDQP